MIADLFHYMKYMERLGSGLRKIDGEIEKLPGYIAVYNPEISSTATDFRVILKNANYQLSQKNLVSEQDKSPDIPSSTALSIFFFLLHFRSCSCSFFCSSSFRISCTIFCALRVQRFSLFKACLLRIRRQCDAVAVVKGYFLVIHLVAFWEHLLAAISTASSWMTQCPNFRQARQPLQKPTFPYSVSSDFSTILYKFRIPFHGLFPLSQDLFYI